MAVLVSDYDLDRYPFSIWYWGIPKGCDFRSTVDELHVCLKSLYIYVELLVYMY